MQYKSLPVFLKTILLKAWIVLRIEKISFLFSSCQIANFKGFTAFFPLLGKDYYKIGKE